jgi:hypothetical protein
MKPLTLFSVVALFIATGVQAQEVSCVHLHYRDTTLCTLADGTGVLTDFDDGGGFRESRYDAGHWQPMLTKLVMEDTAKLQARLAQLAAVEEQSRKDSEAFNTRLALERKAMDIRQRKACVAAGFVWRNRICSVPEETK